MKTSSWNWMRIRLALSARTLSHFLTFVMLTLMSRGPRSSPTIAPSKETTFPLNHIPSLLPSEPSKIPCHSPVEVLNSFGHSEQGLCGCLRIDELLGMLVLTTA